jgi:hypothetical protein
LVRAHRRIALGLGSHFARVRPSKPAIAGSFAGELYHIPIRSLRQLEAKLAAGSAGLESISGSKGASAVPHWVALKARMLDLEKSPELHRRVVLNYGSDETKDIGKLRVVAFPAVRLRDTPGAGIPQSEGRPRPQSGTQLTSGLNPADLSVGLHESRVLVRPKLFRRTRTVLRRLALWSTLIRYRLRRERDTLSGHARTSI